MSLPGKCSLRHAVGTALFRFAFTLIALGCIATFLIASSLSLLAEPLHHDRTGNRYRSHPGENWYGYNPYHADLVIYDRFYQPLVAVGKQVMGWMPSSDQDWLDLEVRRAQSGFASRQPRARFGEHGFIEVEVGWPAPALGSTVILDSSQAIEPKVEAVLGGILVYEGDHPRGLRWFTTIPVRPVWPGFVINTAFYAALASIPFLIIRLRRLRRCAGRERRGECIWCRYDISGLDRCPECGGPRMPWRHAIMAGAIRGRRSDRFLRRVNRAPAVGSSDRPTTKA